ncbi:MAG: DsbA family protein, partial [Kangiellaceae bacterium]|nr:DsbA family protein [Kangiellaceae bacterium]
QEVEIELKPILFAGLLNHWQNVGPAEIPPKRIFTYKHCYWKAKSLGVPFKMPPAHPFNSLAALRLAIALNCKLSSVKTIFSAIWEHGFSLQSEDCIDFLQTKLAITNLPELIGQQSVKNQLRANTERAAQLDVFGVPTFVPLGDTKEHFWGLDATEMLLDYLKDPISFRDSQMQKIEQLPEGVQRKR